MSSSRVAIVTGAGSGIGAAAARMLAASGYALALSGRSVGPLRALAEAVAGGDGPEPLVIQADMGIEMDVHALVDTTLDRHGRIDVLVNNAGVGWNRPVKAHDPAMIRRTMEVNALGPLLAVHRAWPAFEKQRSGCVVNVSSMATFEPFPGFFAYACSKGAIDLLARVVSIEGRSIGVRGFSVAPGAVETPLLRRSFDERAVPAHKCLTPDRVGQLILECIEGKHDAENGRVLGIWIEGGEVVTRVR
ncbi:MAG: SDR family oxidoreductase [Planctomycetota bacterium]|nr:SDR family oxidoreductase [Planctomycetota bacterium]